MAQQQNGPIIRPATASIAQMKLDEVRRQHAQGQTLNLRMSQTKPPVSEVHSLMKVVFIGFEVDVNCNNLF